MACVTSTKIICNFGGGECSSEDKLGCRVEKCKGFLFKDALRPTLAINGLRFDGATSDFTSGLNIKQIYSFDKYIFGVSDMYRLYYMSVYSPGFISQDAIFSDIPQMREIYYNGKPAALFFTSKSGDPSIIWTSPDSPIVALPSLNAVDLIQRSSKIYGITPQRIGIEYIDSPYITEWSIEERTPCFSGNAIQAQRLEEAEMRIYAFGNTAVMRVNGDELTTLAMLGGISPQSVCKIGENIYFTAQSGLYRLNCNTVERIASISFGSAVKALAVGEYVIMFDDKVYVYSTETQRLSSLGEINAASVCFNIQTNKVIILTKSGSYKQLELSANSSEYAAEYVFSTEALTPHTVKRLNYINFVGKGSFKLTIKGYDGSICSSSFVTDGKRPYVMPVNKTSNGFTITVSSTLSPDSCLKSLAGNFTLLNDDLL